MANHVLNDRNEWVIATGAPGSLERIKCEWPAAIEKLTALRLAGANEHRIRCGINRSRTGMAQADKRHALVAAGFSSEQALRIVGGMGA